MDLARPELPPPSPPPADRRRAGWTLPALIIGLGTIALCLLVPQMEENRRIARDLDQLRVERERIEEQIRVNDTFLAKVSVDPTLITRLAQRQLRLTPPGTDTLDISGLPPEARSPFQLVTVPPPPAMIPHTPVGGTLLAPLRDGRTRLYLMAAALFVVAAALILDGPKKSGSAPESAPESVADNDAEAPAPAAPVAPRLEPATHTTPPAAVVAA